MLVLDYVDFGSKTTKNLMIEMSNFQYAEYTIAKDNFTINMFFQGRRLSICVGSMKELREISAELIKEADYMKNRDLTKFLSSIGKIQSGQVVPPTPPAAVSIEAEKPVEEKKPFNPFDNAPNFTEPVKEQTLQSTTNEVVVEEIIVEDMPIEVNVEVQEEPVKEEVSITTIVTPQVETVLTEPEPSNEEIETVIEAPADFTKEEELDAPATPIEEPVSEESHEDISESSEDEEETVVEEPEETEEETEVPESASPVQEDEIQPDTEVESPAPKLSNHVINRSVPERKTFKDL